MKIYIGCSLTDASPAFISEINELKQRLRQVHYTVLEFLGTSVGTAEDVVIHDSDCVEQCNLFVAICTYPSTGLGIEIGMACHFGKSILTASKRDQKITRMVLGLSAIHSKHLHTEYDEVLDLLPLIERILM